MTQQLAESAGMTPEGNGSVTARREKLGLSKAKLSAMAGVDRETLTKIEAGQPVTQTKATQVEDALRTREFEYGMDVAEAAPTAPASVEQMEVVVEGDLGVRVTVKGPITDREAIVDSVVKIMRSIRESSPDTSTS
jgi:DNA-binding XRE family transcriptional regulator